MKAIINYSNQKDNARNYSGEKELVTSYKVIAYKNKEFKNIIDLRCWMGRSSSASVVYASIWVSSQYKKKGSDGLMWTEYFSTSGKGQAGGYGYDKESQAIENAILSSGIRLSKMIGGVGESAVREALTAIAKSLRYNKTHISIAHGG